MVDESKGIAYVDGQYVAAQDATVPLLSMAFLRSDAVFDAFSVSNGQFFRLDDPMERFREACSFVRMSSPLTNDEMKHVAAQCVDRANLADAIVYIICARGRDPLGMAFVDPRTCVQEFYAFALPYYAAVPEE